MNVGQVKSTKTELNQFADTLTRIISGLKHTGQYDLDSALTSLMVPSLSKSLQIEQEAHSKEHENVPPIDKLIQYIHFRASVLSNTPSFKTPETKPEPSPHKPEHQPRKHRAAVHSTTPNSSYGPKQASGMSVSCALVTSTPYFNVPSLTICLSVKGVSIYVPISCAVIAWHQAIRREIVGVWLDVGLMVESTIPWSIGTSLQQHLLQIMYLHKLSKSCQLPIRLYPAIPLSHCPVAL